MNKKQINWVREKIYEGTKINDERIDKKYLKNNNYNNEY